MANLELDPMFRRGLRLLHSRSRDSADQLKAIVDELVRQRQGKSIPSMNKDPFSMRRESPIPRSKPGSPIPVSLSRKEEMKKEMDRKLVVIRDDDMVLIKRPRLDSPSTFKSHTPSPTPSLKSESSSRSRKSDESDSDPEMNDLRMEITDGISCTVCKNFVLKPRNKLVECQECHSLYHQECHKPPVTDQDVNDPRLVWYCSKCTKSMKKQSSLVSQSGGNGVGGRGVSSGSISGMSGSNNSSSSGSGSSSSSKSGSMSRPTASPTKGLGMTRPSPFTNLSSASGRSLGSSSSSSSNNGSKSSLSSSSSSSSKSSAPSNSMISAERRMQLMKKKAAAKMAEKRKL
ncbi:Integrator complex subunit 12 [Halocaridina rubra]|uniref:Integrator complex subunit 12 n=1 Tax=Halocaridina rubra TaxID=373956 RepID=A0AAN8XCP9_HALRR